MFPCGADRAGPVHRFDHGEARLLQVVARQAGDLQLMIDDADRLRLTHCGLTTVTLNSSNGNNTIAPKPVSGPVALSSRSATNARTTMTTDARRKMPIG